MIHESGERQNNGATQQIRRARASSLVGEQMRQLRSLIIQVKYGTFDLTDRIWLSWGSREPTTKKGEAMKKTMMALAAAATLAVSALAAPAPAHAQRGVAAGVAAGLIGGAIVGGAIASQNGGYYGPGYGPGYYGSGPAYYGGPAYVAGPGYGPDGCFWQRQRFWDGYGWRIRRVRVCG
jgi:hypothetical protein